MLVKFAPPDAWALPGPESMPLAEASVMPLDPGGDAASFPSCFFCVSGIRGWVPGQGHIVPVLFWAFGGLGMLGLGEVNLACTVTLSR